MPTEIEIEQAMRCEYRGQTCCLAGTECDHPGVLPSVKRNRHCEDLVNDHLCPFLDPENIYTGGVM